MSTKHTPGPWRIQRENVVTFDALGQCAMICGKDTEANARLIAAAPDLLEACHHALKTVDVLRDDAVKLGRHQIAADLHSIADCLYTAVYSAITKATGDKQ